MKIENGTLILYCTDIDHIIDFSDNPIPSEGFKEGLENELFLHGLEETPYSKIELRLDNFAHCF